MSERQWSGRSRSTGVAIVILAACIPFQSAPAVAWEDLDAPSLAMAGIASFHRLDQSPAAPAALGTSLSFSAVEPFRGADLRAGSVHLQSIEKGWGSALSFSQLQSPVHQQKSIIAALQQRRGMWSSGVSVHCRWFSFGLQGASTELHGRIGLAAIGPHRFRLVSHLSARLHNESSPRLQVAVAVPLDEALELQLALSRTPGLSSRLRLGLLWDRPTLQMRTGFDAATSAVSAGFSLQVHRILCSWGAQSHPDLGWSHAWTVAFRR